MKSKKYLYGIVTVAAAIVVMLVIYLVGKPDVTLGSKSVDIAVTDDEGYEKQYFINTEAQYLKPVSYTHLLETRSEATIISAFPLNMSLIAFRLSSLLMPP